MAGNIYGYQGVHTPLESVTQGRYTLSDYTSMRTELTSRLIALENQGGFIPTNVEITGYLHMLPGGAGMGEIETTSSITGESLYINSLAECGSLQCNGNLAVGGTVSATAVNFSGNVGVTGLLTTNDIFINATHTISGDGSGLFNLNDNTKLPLLGGTISGNLTVSGFTTVNNQLASGNTIDASNRQVTSSYFNFQGVNNAPSYIGRIYASTGGMVLDLSNITSVPNGTFVFYTNDGVNVTNPLTITPTSVNITGNLNMGVNAINSSGAITGGNFYGNGSGLTNLSVINTTAAVAGGTYYPVFTLSGSAAVNATPYTSGNMSYYATTNTLTVPNVTSYGVFSGNGSLLSSVAAISAPYSGLTGAVPTWNQSTTGNAATATNVAYSGLTGIVPTWNQNTTGTAAIATNMPYTGLTGVTPTWNQSTTGNAATATSVAAGAAGKVLYQSGASVTAFTAVGTVGQVLTSQGAAAPIWTTSGTTDVTKVPLAGGTMTGILNFTQGGLSYANNYKRDINIGWDNPVLGVFIPLDYSQSVHDYYRINFSNGDCTINLQNLSVIAATHQDLQRKVTIVKCAMASGDYVVTLLPPTGYTFFDATHYGALSTTIPLGRFSATYIIAYNAFASVVDLVAFT